MKCSRPTCIYHCRQLVNAISQLCSRIIRHIITYLIVCSLGGRDKGRRWWSRTGSERGNDKQHVLLSIRILLHEEGLYTNFFTICSPIQYSSTLHVCDPDLQDVL